MSPATNPVKVWDSVIISCSLALACTNETIHWSWYYTSNVLCDMRKMRVDMNDTGIRTSFEISPVNHSDIECVANINGSMYRNSFLLTVEGKFDM